MKTPWTNAHTGRFWVIGGLYTDLDFRKLATPAAPLGPFKNRHLAEIAWRSVSFNRTAAATERFVIVEETITAQAA